MRSKFILRSSGVRGNFLKISFIYYKIYITTVYFPIIYKVCIWFTWCRIKQWYFSPNYLLWLHKYKLTSARLLGTMHMLFIYAHAYLYNLLYSLNVLLATPSLFNYTLIFRHPLIIQNVALTPPPFPLKKGGGYIFFHLSGNEQVIEQNQNSICSINILKITVWV